MSAGVAILIALGCLVGIVLLRYAWKYLLIGVGVIISIGLFGWICWFWFRELLTPLLAIAGAAHGWIGWLWAVPLSLFCLAVVFKIGSLGSARKGSQKNKEVKMKWLKSILKWVIWIAVIFFLLVMPFIDKGLVVPDKWQGATIGRALGENVNSWMNYWNEFFSGLVGGGVKGQGP